MTMLVLLFAFAALPTRLGALRLRSPAEDESFSAPLDAPLRELPLNESMESLSARVPSIDVFRRVWTMRYSLERHLQEPLPSSIKLVLGLFTVAQDAAYRQVVRETWLNQTGVCYWDLEPRDNCSVYVAFVIGKSGSGSPDVTVSDKEMRRAQREHGMLVLDTEENMNKGKSLTWFRTALARFPWATHIGKVDMDTYPFLHKLVNRMGSNRSCVKALSQYEFIGRPHNNCGPVFTHACPYDPCLGQFTSAADSARPVASLNGEWRYLSGEIYIMSMPLVQMLPFKHQNGNEDQAIGREVASAAETNHICVALRRLDAWYHKTLSVDGAYSNEW